MEKLRVLITDDHPLFRNGMKGLLSVDELTLRNGRCG